jgi:DNA helicase-4
MIVKATEIVRVDDDVRTYSHILVDEFQDISFARVALLQAFKINDKETKFFCVGDDWQSIYQFAGSNIDAFLNFEKYFGYTRKITLDTTFRFNR